jgi:hypothetical protein
MQKETLLATLRETLRDVSEKLPQSGALLVRLRNELATFADILRRAEERETRANQEHEKLVADYRELLAASNEAPATDPLVDKIGDLSREQTRTHDELLAARDAVKKYQEQVRVSKLALAAEELNHKALQKARDDLTWQIKKLSAARE